MALPPLAPFLTPGRTVPPRRRYRAERTHGVLSSIATAVMTVIGVLLSVTLLVLPQVSQQYAPHVIENFIRSTTNQVVFGFYVGALAYSRRLLRSVSDDQEASAPQLALVIAIVLGPLLGRRCTTS